MEESKKLYNQKSIALATFLGGPMAAGYLVKKNYQFLNQNDNGLKAFFIGIISTLFLLGIVFYIPEEILDNIPNALMPAIYMPIVYFLVERYQGDELLRHKEADGEFYSKWKAAGVGSVFLAILLGVIFTTAFIAGDLSVNYDVDAYNKEFDSFTTNEENALAVFDQVETLNSEYLIKVFNRSIILWRKNKQCVDRMNAIENIPEEIILQNNKLLTYCDLRVRHCELFIKTLKEDSEEYVSEIEQVAIEINSILEEINQ